MFVGQLLTSNLKPRQWIFHLLDPPSVRQVNLPMFGVVWTPRISTHNCYSKQMVLAASSHLFGQIKRTIYWLPHHVPVTIVAPKLRPQIIKKHEKMVRTLTITDLF